MTPVPARHKCGSSQLRDEFRVAGLCDLVHRPLHHGVHLGLRIEGRRLLQPVEDRAIDNGLALKIRSAHTEDAAPLL